MFLFARTIHRKGHTTSVSQNIIDHPILASLISHTSRVKATPIEHDKVKLQLHS